MALAHNVVFTVIPAGKIGAGSGKRRFSIHVAPRLGSSGYLSWYPLFIDWPKIARDLSTVTLNRLGSGPGYTLQGKVTATRISDLPDSDLWSRLFTNPDTLPVDAFNTSAFGARFKDSTFHSYPILPMHDFHTKFFTALAVDNEVSSPTPAALKTNLGGLAKIAIRDDRKRIEGLINNEFQKGDGAAWGKVLPHGSARPRAGTTEQNLADHLQFLRYLEPQTDPEYIKKNPTVRPPRLDFHRIVSMLADHPHLLRLLGLVMDYEVDAGTVVEAGQFLTTSFLQLDSASVTGLPGPLGFPRTALNPVPFLARVRDKTKLDAFGSANLSNAYNSRTGQGWGVIALDVEGTAAKAIGLADTVHRNDTFGTSDINKPKTIDVPAPRSGGLSLVRGGRSLDVVASFKRSSELLEGTAAGATPTPSLPVLPDAAAPGPSGDGVELYAEDLIRGWRVDVWDESVGAWRSLTKRDTTYQFSAKSQSPVPLEVDDAKGAGTVSTDPRLYLNEGVISLGVAASADPAKTNDDTFVHEIVLEWNGWSLVAPRPGKTLSATTNLPQDQVTPYNEDLDLEIKVQATPGTLPRLRYGHRYRFRLRSANLAGNGPTLEGVGASKATLGSPTSDVAYSRFEPLPPPALAQYEKLATGESVTQLVIKSEDENSPVVAAGSSVRHLLPPAANAHLVELHGVLDTMLPSVAYSLLADREGGQLDGDPPTWMTVAPYHRYVTPGTDPSSGARETPVFFGEIPQPPWLVDPAAEGIRLSGPEMGVKAAAYALGPLGWADAQSSRVTLRGLGVNQPATLAALATTLFGSATTRRFEVSVAKGEQFTITMSSTMRSTLQDHFGIVQLLKKRVPAPPSLPARLGRVGKGQNRVVTPPTFLTVVHAVRKPLVEPRVLPATAFVTRFAGETFAVFGARIACHPQSTSRLDMNLSWSEWVDRPGDFVSDETTPGNPYDTTDRPRIVSGEGRTNPLNVVYPEPGVRPTNVSANGLRHEFGDTKHRLVRITLTGTSRYARYFTREENFVVSALTYGLPSSVEGVQELSERLVEIKSGQVLQRGTEYTMNYRMGLINFNSASRTKYNGKTINVSWVPGNVTRDTEEINGQYVHVKSSARPAPPVVSDVFPLFVDDDWQPLKLKGFTIGASHKRNGQALRVYLERPWYSSGDNEMLGVVLYRAPGKTKAPGGTVAPPTTPIVGPGGVTTYDAPKSSHQQFTSAWGRDPLVVGSAAPTKLTAASFPLAASAPLFGKWVSGLSLPGTNTGVYVVPHEVKFDEQQGLWFCDIQVNMGSAYRPFLRLALARFQPYSLTNCHLSAVALLDSAQLSPNRTLTVSGFGNTRVVSLTGPMYASAITGVERPMAFTAADTPEFTRSPLIEVTVQHRPVAFASMSDTENIGWEDIPDVSLPSGVRTYTLTPAAGNVPNGIGKYSASAVNVVSPDANTQVRLVVREYERDSRTLDDILGSEEDPTRAYRKRLAFADTYNLF